MCCTGQSANTWFHNTKTATTKNIKSHSRFSLHQPMNPTKRRQIIFAPIIFVCLPYTSLIPQTGFPVFTQPFFDFETTRTPNRFYCSASGTGCWRFEETCPTPWRFQSRKSSFEGCCGRGAGVEKCGEKPSFLSVYNTVFCWIQVIFLVEMEHDLFRSFFTVNPGFAFKSEKN